MIAFVRGVIARLDGGGRQSTARSSAAMSANTGVAPV